MCWVCLCALCSPKPRRLHTLDTMTPHSNGSTTLCGQILHAAMRSHEKRHKKKQSIYSTIHYRLSPHADDTCRRRGRETEGPHKNTNFKLPPHVCVVIAGVGPFNARRERVLTTSNDSVSSDQAAGKLFQLQSTPPVPVQRHPQPSTKTDARFPNQRAKFTHTYLVVKLSYMFPMCKRVPCVTRPITQSNYARGRDENCQGDLVFFSN